MSPLYVPDILKIPEKTKLSYTASELSALKVHMEQRFGRTTGVGSWEFRNKAIEGVLATPPSRKTLMQRRAFFSEIMDGGRKNLSDIVSKLPSQQISPRSIYGYSFDNYYTSVKRARKLVDLPVNLRRIIELEWKSGLYAELSGFCSDFISSNKEFVETADKIREKGLTYENWQSIIESLEPYLDFVGVGKSLKEQLLTYLIFAHACNSGCLPQFSDRSSKNGRIVNGMHPSYGDWMDTRTGPRIYTNPVPNNAEWNENQRLTLVTGSNSRGKSVYLRMIGLNVLLAMNGFYAIADEMAFSPVRRVWSCFDFGDRVGAGHLETGQEYVAQIRDNATREDLLLIDEPAQGTEPATEYRLAKGLVEFAHLGGFNSFVVTHDLALVSEFSGLESIAFSRVADYDDEKHKYQVSPGIARDGYGMRLAKKFGTDPESLKRAIKKRKKDGSL